jgi:4-hydroxybenzoate polyprenyltransferase
MAQKKSALSRSLEFKKGIGAITLAAIAPLGAWLTGTHTLDTLPATLFFCLSGGLGAYVAWIDDKLTKLRALAQSKEDTHEE